MLVSSFRPSIDYYICGIGLCLGGTYVFFFFFVTQLGPFVDSTHPEIEKGSVDATFTEIFQVEVIRRVLRIQQWIYSKLTDFLINKDLLVFFFFFNFTGARIC